MTNEQKLLPAYLAVGGAVLVGLVKLAHWSIWEAILLAIVLAGIPWLAGVRRGRLRSARWVEAPIQETISLSPEPEPEPEFEREPVTEVRLPSSRPDYHFVFSATVCWHRANVRADNRVFAASTAVNSVVQRARELAEKRDPVHLSLVQPEMRRVLGELRTDTAGYVRAMAESVELTLPEEDRKRLDELAELRKNGELWDHQRRHEQSKRQYLGDDVLKSPGSALVWWLARNETKIGEAVENIHPLRQLSDAANDVNRAEDLDGMIAGLPGNEERSPMSGEPAPSSPVDFFDAFIRTMRVGAEDDRALLAHQMANLVELRDPSLANEMRARFDIEEPDPADED